MESFKNADAGVIVDQLIRTIQEQRDYLSEIDGKIGDGDHGINMNKGFTMCEEKLKGQTYNLSEGLSILGETLLDDIGGSMGPLYGMLFDEMSMACEDAEEINADVFGEMITGAVEGIQEISPAKVGDKSLLDTLVPAKEAFVQAKEEGKGFGECLDAMNEAAEKGWQSTKDLVARIGRASRLGERSRGVLDAGATSCYFIITTIGKGAKSLYKNHAVRASALIYHTIQKRHQKRILMFFFISQETLFL